MVRVRFAPSPTGFLHLGNARTALFNWLFSRHTGGTLILRIEDTDVARSDPKYTREIMKDLRWLGIDWDEGPDVGGPYEPYIQSERLESYRKLSEGLLREGKAYPCYCTPEDLAARRKSARARGKAPRYDNRCRTLSEKERKTFEAEGRPATLRFIVPDKIITVEDLVRGRCEFNLSLFGDFVIMKPDGTPSFHFAVVADDSLMKITHVIRGEDHLTNTPLHILLFEALGYKPPFFTHLPLIKGEEHAILSKRLGDFSIKNFRKLGYLPEALVNYMLLLGWSHREKKEKYTVDKAIERFDIRNVSRSPASFDTKKLDWLAGQYMREKGLDALTELAVPYLQDAALLPRDKGGIDYDKIKRIVDAVRPGLPCLSQMVKEADFFFKRPLMDKDKTDALSTDNAQNIISKVLDYLGRHESIPPGDFKELTTTLSRNMN
ncbi:MAG: glutamate--tRNA ligase, partial [Candidatus Brocadiales bacterium]